MELSLSPSMGVFLFQLVSFFLLFLVVKKFFFPIILDILAKRENYINESIANAKLIEEKKESLDKLEQETLQEIKDKRESSLNDIEKLRNDMMLKTNNDISSLREKKIIQMKKDVEALRDEFLQQQKDEICNVSLSLVEKIVKKEMADEKIRKKFLDDLVDCIDTVEIRAKS